MRDYNKKIEEALILIQGKKIKEASVMLAELVDDVIDRNEIFDVNLKDDDGELVTISMCQESLAQMLSCIHREVSMHRVPLHLGYSP